MGSKTQTGYAYDGTRERFVRVSMTVSDKGTVKTELLDANPDQELAARILIFNRMKLGRIDSTDPRQELGDAQFADQVLLTIRNFELERSDLSTTQRLARLREVLGDDPIIVQLFTSYVDADLAAQLWGIVVVQEEMRNEAPPEEPVRLPANVLPAPDAAQGAGPLGPQTKISDGLTPTGTAAPNRSTSSSSGGAPDGVPDGKGATGPIEDRKTGGDPVILASGCFYLQVSDLAAAGLGLGFDFVRTYLHQTRYNGPLGFNWDHSYNLWLRERQVTDPFGVTSNVVYRSNGMLRADAYRQVTSGDTGSLAPLADVRDAVFEGPPGFFDRLEKVGGRYVLETSAGVRIHYGEHLYVERIVDNNGNTMHFHYDDDTLLRTVVDPLGKAFHLQYDPRNRLIALRDDYGRELRYFYSDNGDLEEVDLITDDGFVAGVDYRYLGADALPELQHNLTALINAYGEVSVENVYDTDAASSSFNRVVLQRSDAGEFRYDYEALVVDDGEAAGDPLNAAVRATRVVFPNGHAIEHLVNGAGLIVAKRERVRNAVGRFETIEARYRYNADGLIVSEQRPGGDIVERIHERERYEALHGNADTATFEERLAFGNVVREIIHPRPGHGETRRIVTDYAYHPRAAAPGTCRLRRQRGPYYAGVGLAELPGQAVPERFVDIDTRGNVTRVWHAPTVDADGTPHQLPANSFEHDERGNVVQAANGGERCELHYFEDALRAGFVREIVADPGGLEQRTTFDVDELGRVTRSRDARGAEVRTTYTAFDAVARRVTPGPGGRGEIVVVNRYDKARRLVSSETTVLDADGRPHPDSPFVQTMRFDRFGRMVDQAAGPASAPRSRTRSRSFHPAGIVDRDVAPDGTVTRRTFDERLAPRTVTGAPGTDAETRATHRTNALGELIETVDGSGGRTNYRYDAYGRLVGITGPDGDRIERELDARGAVTRERLFGPAGSGGTTSQAAEHRWRETAWSYDAAGRPITVSRHLFLPDQQPRPETDRVLQQRTYYDAAGRVHRLVDELGQATTISYDRLGRPVRMVLPDGSERQVEHADANRSFTLVDVERNGEGTTLRTQRATSRFDVHGRLEEAVDHLGNATRLQHDSRGLPTAVELPTGRRVEHRYDIFGDTIARTEHAADEQLTVGWERDQGGRCRALRLPSGRVIVQQHDPLGRVCAVMADDGESATFDHDAAGRLIGRRDPSGVTHTLRYSAAGRLVTVAYEMNTFAPPPGAADYRPAASPIERYEHGPFGPLVADNGQVRTTWRYDSLGRVVEEVRDGLAVGHEYDDAGRRVALRYPDGRRVAFDYTTAGRLRGIRQVEQGAHYPGPSADQNPVEPFAQLDGAGTTVSALSLGPSVRVRLDHDGNGRRVGSHWSDRHGTVLFSERLWFGQDGELRHQQIGDRVRSFTYDGAMRLTGAIDATASPLVSSSAVRPGDDQHRIDAHIAELSTAAARSGPSARWSYDYDDRGNRLRSTHDREGRPGVSAEAVADRADRLVSLNGRSVLHDRQGNVIDDGSRRYRYDAHGRLAELVADGELVTLVRDAAGRVARIVDGSGSVELVHDGVQLIEIRRDGRPVAQLVPYGAPDHFVHVAVGGRELYPVADVMGSISAWLDRDGRIVGRAQYDPFGGLLARDGDWPLPLGFGGHLELSGAAVHLLHARVYHSGMGRFLQPDPLGFVDGPHLYHFAHNAPGTLTDHFGYAGTGVDNWLAKTELAKAIAPFAVWLDDKVTFAAEVGTKLAVNAAIGFGMGLVLTALGPVGLALGAVMLGGGLTLQHFSYEDQAIAAAAKNSYNGASPLLATLLTPLGGTSIYEMVTGEGYFDGRPLDDEAYVEATANGLSSIAGLGAFGRWLTGVGKPPVLPRKLQAVLDAPLGRDDLLGAKIYVTTPIDAGVRLNADKIAAELGTTWEALEPGSLQGVNNAIVIGHGVVPRNSTGALAVEMMANTYEVLHAGPNAYASALKDVYGWRGGRLLMLSCQTGVASSLTGSTFAAEVSRVFAALNARTFVIAPNANTTAFHGIPFVKAAGMTLRDGGYAFPHGFVNFPAP